MKTITICGSMQFISEINQLQTELEKNGFEVLTPHDHESNSGYSQLNEQERADRKKFFIDEHIDKIKNSDAILVANYTKNNIGIMVSGTFLRKIITKASLSLSLIMIKCSPLNLNPTTPSFCK